MQSQVEFSFCGSRSGRAPLTWGQREHWNAVEALRPNTARSNMRYATDLPAGMSLDELVAALRALVERHETLRTNFLRAADGEPTQVVAKEGRMTISVRERSSASVQADAKAVLDELTATEFEHDVEWPIRLAVIADRGTPLTLTICSSHLAVDGTGKDIAQRDLQVLLGANPGKSIPSVVHQPLDQAQYEQSAAGQKILRRSMQRWASALSRAPLQLFRQPAGQQFDPNLRYPALNLYAKGLGAQVGLTAKRLGISSSAVYLAATGVALGEAAGVDAFSFCTLFSNRIPPRTHHYVGNLVQQGIVSVEKSHATFDELAVEMWSKLITGHKASTYHPSALAKLLGDVSPGSSSEVDHRINYLWSDRALKAPAGQLKDGESVCFPAAPVKSTKLRYGLKIATDGSDVLFNFLGDQRYVPLELFSIILKRMESILRNAAE